MDSPQWITRWLKHELEGPWHDYMQWLKLNGCNDVEADLQCNVVLGHYKGTMFVVDGDALLVSETEGDDWDYIGGAYYADDVVMLLQRYKEWQRYKPNWKKEGF